MTHISLCLLWMAAPAVAQEQELLAVRRVFVEQLNGGDSAYQIRDLIISSLERTIAQKRVTYDFERLMSGATLLKTSEFGWAMVENMV